MGLGISADNWCAVELDEVLKLTGNVLCEVSGLMVLLVKPGEAMPMVFAWPLMGDEESYNCRRRSALAT